MGDAAGELTERFHLLRLAELAFGGFAAAHLFEQFLVCGGEPVVRRREPPKDSRVKRAISKPTPHMQKERDRDAGLQQHAEPRRDRLPVGEQRIFLALHFGR